jgi:hypothetical protein
MVTFTSREAYYAHVVSGRATSQKDRIMRYLLTVGRPVTRHEIVDRFFCVHPGPRALDGGRPIPWQSAGGAIAGMVCRTPGCDHAQLESLDQIGTRTTTRRVDGCIAYISIDHEGKCPVTGALSEFLVPIGDRWQNRRLF